MSTCGDCKLLVPDAKGAGFRCTGKRCGATKVTPGLGCQQMQKV